MSHILDTANNIGKLDLFSQIGTNSNPIGVNNLV